MTSCGCDWPDSVTVRVDRARKEHDREGYKTKKISFTKMPQLYKKSFYSMTNVNSNKEQRGIVISEYCIDGRKENMFLYTRMGLNCRRKIMRHFPVSHAYKEQTEAVAAAFRSNPSQWI